MNEPLKELTSPGKVEFFSGAASLDVEFFDIFFFPLRPHWLRFACLAAGREPSGALALNKTHLC